MNSQQFQGLAREIIFAVLAVLVSFDFLPEDATAVIATALVAIAVLLWGIWAKPTDKASTASLVRKAIQTIAPLLLHFGVIGPDQAMNLTALALSIAGIWSIQANKSPDE